MLWKRSAWLMLVLLSISLAAEPVLAQAIPASRELKLVLILTRHGVRAPTWTAEQLNEYSTEPWPNFGVAPGILTAHGRTLMKLFGAYDRAALTAAGLLSPTGCGEGGQVYIWADTDQRTIETGRAMAEGMFPGCSVETHSLPQGATDPLFSPVPAGLGHPNGALAAAAVSGRIGGNPGALLDVYRPALDTMNRVLLGCKPGTRCPPEGAKVKRLLLEPPSAVEAAKGDRLAELRGPIRTAATLAQNFLLEYTNGMPDKEVGWGRMNEADLRQMLSLHAAYEDLLRRTPYIARTQASNLLSHVAKTLEQAIAGKAIPGALGKAGDRAVIIVGHDTNIANIAGTLDLSWLVEGYQPTGTPPGGALVFELWRRAADGAYSVRTYYRTQTLQQMRKALPLTLDSPPAKAAVFVPACSTAEAGFPCEWKAFQRTIEAAIDPAFVKP